MTMNTPLWQPSEAEIVNSDMWRFMQWSREETGRPLNDYLALHTWSVQHPAEFWKLCAQFCQLRWHHPPAQVFQPAPAMRDCRFMVGGKLNFAEHLLARQDDHPAIIETNERQQLQVISYATLGQQVARLAQVLHEQGVTAGDRVVAVLPNSAAAVIAMLATTQLGAVWSACSPDFGLEAIIDRFQPLNPKLLITADGHFYRGKNFIHAERNRQLQQQLPSLAGVIHYRYLDPTAPLENCLDFNSCLHHPIAYPHYVTRDFNDPLYVLFSSGTTGKPKAMVHGIGGTLLQHLKELRLHTGLNEQSRLLFYTTTAWMMWHWQVSSLALGTTLVLYEGCPQYPSIPAFFSLLDTLAITHFGAGAKFFELCQQQSWRPRQDLAFRELRCILSTGSVLSPSSFDYVYQAIKPEVRLSSISGGSDIISCFALGNPLLPVWRGELQCKGLGMNVKIVDEQGNALINQKGELVCATPFPSMPLYFWNDTNDKLYQHAYFDRFPNIWTHGDFALETEHHGLIMLGRSDATLNPKGVRIGSAEIYAQLTAFPQIKESLAIGQPWRGDERIVLFVILDASSQLTPHLVEQIKQHIRQHTTSHHVPAKIIAVTDLPRTPNNKLAEIWVKRIISGDPLPNTSTLANPECLTQFIDCQALQEE